MISSATPPLFAVTLAALCLLLGFVIDAAPVVF